MRDFTLNPPPTVTIETHSWSRDSNGNPTAHHLILWTNGKTGAEYQGGQYATKRRGQTGYSDVSEAALLDLESMFPNAVYQEVKSERQGDRSAGRCFATFERKYELESVPVIFRTVKSGDHKGAVDAFFPTLSGDRTHDSCTVYAHIGQHATGSKAYYRDATRPATVAEYASLKRELESAPFKYRLDVKTRWIQAYDLKRWECEK